jgi:hypothetical protein
MPHRLENNAARIGTALPPIHWCSIEINTTRSDSESEKPMEDGFKYQIGHSPSIAKLQVRKMGPHIQQLITTELVKSLYNFLLNFDRDEISRNFPVTQSSPNQEDFLRDVIK